MRSLFFFVKNCITIIFCGNIQKKETKKIKKMGVSI